MKKARGIYFRACEHGHGNPCDGAPKGFTCDLCRTDGCNRFSERSVTTDSTQQTTIGITTSSTKVDRPGALATIIPLLIAKILSL